MSNVYKDLMSIFTEDSNANANDINGALKHYKVR